MSRGSQIPKYRLDDLGWFEFERLCQALLQSKYGLVVAAWGGSGDHGRDAYSCDQLEFPKLGDTAKAPIVFQAKFVQEANAAGAKPGPALEKAVTAEVGRIEDRVDEDEWDKPGTYALLSNAPITAGLRKKLTDKLTRALPGSKIVICGEADISAMLSDAPGIRTSFPQLLGLQDLTELLRQAGGRDSQVRGDLIMEEAAELSRVFVPTTAYNRALAVLGTHGFVVLTGPPEMGKTSIALMIALARLGDGWEVFDCASPDDFFRVYEKERRQVFIADDAFGSTEYSPSRAEEWARELHKVIRAVDRDHWLLWTSRPAPLRLGLRQLQLNSGVAKFPDPGEVQVDASSLRRAEKALILYRHCKDVGLSEAAKDLIRKHATFVTGNSDFTPERIRRLVKRLDSLAQEELSDGVVRSALAAELEQSTDRMRKSFESLDDEHKRLLVAMLDSGPGLVGIDALEVAYGRHAPPSGNTPIADLVADLEYHFVRPL